MENKYYTPSISEFHIGFEFEMKVHSKWLKKEFSFQDTMIRDVVYLLGKGGIRVKYLDEEDIKSIGWEWVADNVAGSEFRMGDYKLFWIKGKGVCVRVLQFIMDLVQYNGLCKNKSKLRMIMKDLNIPGNEDKH